MDRNEQWEAGVKRFARALYGHRPFLDDFEPFVARVAEAAERPALGQVVLKLTAPGVPDIYQGDELPYRALVDPDNRRPVDWDRRRSLLRALRAGAAPDAETRKLWLIERLLDLRARRPEAFAGGYEPLDASPGVCAFVRGREVAVAVAVRPGAESAFRPERGRWVDVLGAAVPGITVLERIGR